MAQGAAACTYGTGAGGRADARYPAATATGRAALAPSGACLSAENEDKARGTPLGLVATPGRRLADALARLRRMPGADSIAAGPNRAGVTHANSAAWCGRWLRRWWDPRARGAWGSGRASRGAPPGSRWPRSWRDPR